MLLLPFLESIFYLFIVFCIGYYFLSYKKPKKEHNLKPPNQVDEDCNWFSDIF